jgi:hypothetical protein
MSHAECHKEAFNAEYRYAKCLMLSVTKKPLIRSIVMLSVTNKSLTLSVVMLVSHAECHKEAFNAEYRYADCLMLSVTNGS